jgi:hypothetical protein
MPLQPVSGNQAMPSKTKRTQHIHGASADNRWRPSTQMTGKATRKQKVLPVIALSRERPSRGSKFQTMNRLTSDPEAP